MVRGNRGDKKMVTTKNAIVRHHNDFNKLSLGNFTELEQNLLFAIFVKSYSTSDFIIEMSLDDIKSFVNVNRNNTEIEIKQIVENLKTNFFKLDFSIIEKENNKISKTTFNLFSYFKITYDDNNSDKIEKIGFKVNPDFAYLLNSLTKNMTQYELEEFIFLRGKYPKILYRLLKEFRTTGYYFKEWQDFKELMGIPESMSQNMIETRILKPCVEKLTETIKTSLFDERIPFKKLEYKLKKKSSQRGKPTVTRIEFYFEPQNSSCLDERKNYINEQNAKNPIIEKDKPHYITELKKLCEKKIELKTKNGDILKLLDVLCDGEGKYHLLHRKNDNIAEQAPLDYETAQKILKAVKF